MEGRRKERRKYLLDWSLSCAFLLLLLLFLLVFWSTENINNDSVGNYSSLPVKCSSFELLTWWCLVREATKAGVNLTEEPKTMTSTKPKELIQLKNFFTAETMLNKKLLLLLLVVVVVLLSGKNDKDQLINP